LLADGLGVLVPLGLPVGLFDGLFDGLGLLDDFLEALALPDGDAVW
jgi:hypothetical protein